MRVPFLLPASITTHPLPAGSTRQWWRESRMSWMQMWQSGARPITAGPVSCHRPSSTPFLVKVRTAMVRSEARGPAAPRPASFIAAGGSRRSDDDSAGPFAAEAAGVPYSLYRPARSRADKFRIRKEAARPAPFSCRSRAVLVPFSCRSRPVAAKLLASPRVYHSWVRKMYRHVPSRNAPVRRKPRPFLPRCHAMRSTARNLRVALVPLLLSGSYCRSAPKRGLRRRRTPSPRPAPQRPISRRRRGRC